VSIEGDMQGEPGNRDHNSSSRSSRPQDGSEACNLRGTVVVAGAWLAFYAAAAIYTAMNTGNPSRLPADHSIAAASIRADGTVPGK
jgi:hypothetical protein